MAQVIIGVDPHKLSATIEVVDSHEKLLGSGRFSTDHPWDSCATQRRVAVVGGAGSGKTWLALEQTRRLAKEGQSVALVCCSRGLAHFL